MLTAQQVKKRDKYLKQYAEPIVQDVGLLATRLSDYHLANALVIPAYQETSDFIQRLTEAPLAQQSACFVLVINQPQSQQDLSGQQALYHQACQLGELITEQQNITVISLANSHSLLILVDCFTQPMPDHQGVGLARKVGCDLVIALQHAGIIKPCFIGSSDADAYLPDDYFSEMAQANIAEDAALCYPFEHRFIKDKLTVSEQQIENATQAYQQAMRYYVNGLRYAGSHYAFYTIGSILALSPLAYVDVRGFVKKSAGEDFYTLNKLAKLGSVQLLNGQPITLTPRLSERVPFGTGPAVKSIIDLQEKNQPYCYYHFQCFVELRQAQLLLGRFSQSDVMNELLVSKGDEQTLNAVLNQITSTLSKYSKHALHEIGFTDFIIGQVNRYSGNQAQLVKQINDWFDAFKTLKFIHSIKRQGFDDLPLRQAIEQAPF
ncbi:hypothetical protein LP316_11620 [Thalassotalea sp. LPB0316]|uniref:hypothetical protein n=1 Tax=Thalassotalea sp. LPB0316 TaxID=2769490 RepID=UPI001867255E|nr:hypothetical protein [Thalassotalea sp. LPB0316]QOL24950.1 hypothetical protein LP316_11620 [Thalassotalea sp. LPB0316]